MNHIYFCDALIGFAYLKLQSASVFLEKTSICTLATCSRMRLTDSLSAFLYLVIFSLKLVNEHCELSRPARRPYVKKIESTRTHPAPQRNQRPCHNALQKGGVPATPSGTATLLRLSPNHLFRPRPLLPVTDFRRPKLSWLDGRCVQGPGTYSPRHG